MLLPNSFFDNSIRRSFMVTSNLNKVCVYHGAKLGVGKKLGTIVVGKSHCGGIRVGILNTRSNCIMKIFVKQCLQ